MLLGRALADPWMRGERGELVLVGQLERDLLGDRERVLARGELVDEPRAPREERRQLVSAQLPR